MTIDKVKEVTSAEPFQPFTIHLADGRSVPVVHPEYLITSPQGRTVVVYQPDDAMNIIDVRLVTDLEIPTNGSA